MTFLSPWVCIFQFDNKIFYRLVFTVCYYYCFITFRGTNFFHRLVFLHFVCFCCKGYMYYLTHICLLCRLFTNYYGNYFMVLKCFITTGRGRLLLDLSTKCHVRLEFKLWIFCNQIPIPSQQKSKLGFDR